jgi:hypothetical protein
MAIGRFDIDVARQRPDMVARAGDGTPDRATRLGARQQNRRSEPGTSGDPGVSTTDPEVDCR